MGGAGEMVGGAEVPLNGAVGGAEKFELAFIIGDAVGSPDVSAEEGEGGIDFVDEVVLSGGGGLRGKGDDEELAGDEHEDCEEEDNDDQFHEGEGAPGGEEFCFVGGIFHLEEPPVESGR